MGVLLLNIASAGILSAGKPSLGLAGREEEREGGKPSRRHYARVYKSALLASSGNLRRARPCAAGPLPYSLSPASTIACS